MLFLEIMKIKVNNLVVDLDGSLIKNDLLIDAILLFIFKNPLNIFRIIKFLFKGKSNLKYKLAQEINIDPQYLPYNENVLEIIKKEREGGKKIILATASNEKYADQISRYLGLFDGVFASDEKTNLRSKNKADKLVSKFGEGGFDYIGDSKDDLNVWKKSNISYIVKSKCGKILKKLKKLHRVKNVAKSSKIQIIEKHSKKSCLRIWLKQIRIHQWSKNLLVFVPLLASHSFFDFESMKYSILAFILFSLCASSVYILNDLVDMQSDRAHKTKKNRPIASGNISVCSALLSCVILLIISLIVPYYLMPIWFFISLISYYVLTLSYSLVLKKLEIFDVIILASLYTMRIIAGAFAISVNLTFWILSFSMFIFLSLALVKRHSEIFDCRKSGKEDSISGRGYCTNDLEMISSLGAAAGYLSVMILALYVQDPNTIELYSKPRIIWFACPVFLFWISRIWMLTHRGKIHEDPVFFAIKDKVSWVVVAILAVIFCYAT